MIKSSCNLTLNCKIITENPIQIKDFGMEKIYEVEGEYIRISGKKDRFIINYSDGLTSIPKCGDYVTITGTLRNIMIQSETEEGSFYTKVYVLAKNIEILDGEPELYVNEITFTNVELINKSEIRKSFNDDSIDIIDIKLKVRRAVDKFNIFKCTCWNNNARLISNIDEGTILNVVGRLQSKDLKNGAVRTEIAINSLAKSDGGDNGSITANELS